MALGVIFKGLGPILGLGCYIANPNRFYIILFVSLKPSITVPSELGESLIADAKKHGGECVELPPSVSGSGAVNLEALFMKTRADMLKRLEQMNPDDVEKLLDG